MFSNSEINEIAINAMTTYWQATSLDVSIAEQHLAGVGAVFELENKLKSHYNKKYALCISNATMGLYSIALALDIKEQDFITTPLTYGASLSGFLLQQNHPIFATIDPQTLTIDPESVTPLITPNTRAILAVDWLGNPCDSLALRQIADEYGLWYIADAAQSLGASRQGLPASVYADAIVISFTVGKSIFAGEGGAIVTDNEALYQKLVWLTQHPYRQKRDLGLSLTNEFALNVRIHPLAAAIANAIFEESLQYLQQHQDWCLRVIDALNEIELTQPLDFRKNAIIPSFFRLCTPWKKERQDRDLLKELAHKNLSIKLKSYSLSYLFEQPYYQAQYQHFWQQKVTESKLPSWQLVEIAQSYNKTQI
jgi:perosamine synthetase